MFTFEKKTPQYYNIVTEWLCAVKLALGQTQHALVGNAASFDWLIWFAQLGILQCLIKVVFSTILFHFVLFFTMQHDMIWVEGKDAFFPLNYEKQLHPISFAFP